MIQLVEYEDCILFQEGSHIQGAVSEILVELFLHISHVSIQDDLFLSWKAGLHVRLDPSEQERLENCVQLVKDLQGSTIKLTLLCFPGRYITQDLGFIQPLTEGDWSS